MYRYNVITLISYLYKYAKQQLHIIVWLPVVSFHLCIHIEAQEPSCCKQLGAFPM